ncbi:N-acetylmuramoyl-L-alanine amidase LytC [Desulfitobacterium hafniense]|uniref:N-acetylmuramoyl-L-alanine amidase LytC n=1 Tax=Desulfitobacterium hafniense TaxID=49338 RepID=A0A098B9B6_DESHA|nr:cell wall-binding repeat-containing protein [Desulfitobacterium hafniense]CDX04965.1 N-acetylmuramoyl-L-alanine amidase LytC [Desulfitobacterium hafniense]
MSKMRQKWLAGCIALAFSVSTLFSPALAMAATDSATADILRLGGKDRYETAAQIAQQGWQKSDYAVLSAGMNENLVDALTAAPLAKAKNAPILLTEGGKLNSFTQQELSRLGVKEVYVTSGSKVIRKPVLDQLEAMGITVNFLGGKDRFDTAVNIAKELPEVTELVVTTAWANADALSVASIAATKGIPILLTDSQSLNADVEAYVDSIWSKVTKTYVLGGSGAIKDSVKASLPNSVRIGGEDRYATNREILKTFVSDLKSDQILIANGKNAHLVDSLAGAPYAALSQSPMVLVDERINSATKEFLKTNLLPDKVVALGGEQVVGIKLLKSLLSDEEDDTDVGTQGNVFSGKLAYKGQKDSYTYVAPKTGRYRFDFGTDDVTSSYRFYMKAMNNRDLANVTTGRYTVGATVDLTAGEQYTVAVSQYEGTPAYTIKIGIPNDPAVIIGDVFSGKLAYTDQKDSYTYIAPKTGRYRFDFGTDDVTSSYRFYMKAMNNKDLANVTTGRYTVGATVDLTVGEQYTIEISQYEGTPAYTIKIGIPNDPAVIIGDVFSGKLAYTDQKDSYTYIAPKTGRYRFDFETDDVKSSYRFYMKAMNNKDLANVTTGRYTVGATVDLTVGEQYTIEVSQYEGTPVYTITIGMP